MSYPQTSSSNRSRLSASPAWATKYASRSNSRGVRAMVRPLTVAVRCWTWTRTSPAHTTCGNAAAEPRRARRMTAARAATTSPGSAVARTLSTPLFSRSMRSLVVARRLSRTTAPCRLSARRPAMIAPVTAGGSTTTVALRPDRAAARRAPTRSDVTRTDAPALSKAAARGAGRAAPRTASTTERPSNTVALPDRPGPGWVAPLMPTDPLDASLRTAGHAAWALGRLPVRRLCTSRTCRPVRWRIDCEDQLRCR